MAMAQIIPMSTEEKARVRSEQARALRLQRLQQVRQCDRALAARVRSRGARHTRKRDEAAAARAAAAEAEAAAANLETLRAKYRRSLALLGSGHKDASMQLSSVGAAAHEQAGEWQQASKNAAARFEGALAAHRAAAWDDGAAGPHGRHARRRRAVQSGEGLRQRVRARAYAVEQAQQSALAEANVPASDPQADGGYTSSGEVPSHGLGADPTIMVRVERAVRRHVARPDQQSAGEAAVAAAEKLQREREEAGRLAQERDRAAAARNEGAVASTRADANVRAMEQGLAQLDALERARRNARFVAWSATREGQHLADSTKARTAENARKKKLEAAFEALFIGGRGGKKKRASLGDSGALIDDPASRREEERALPASAASSGPLPRQGASAVSRHPPTDTVADDREGEGGGGGGGDEADDDWSAASSVDLAEFQADIGPGAATAAASVGTSTTGGLSVHSLGQSTTSSLNELTVYSLSGPSASDVDVSSGLAAAAGGASGDPYSAEFLSVSELMARQAQGGAARPASHEAAASAEFTSHAVSRATAMDDDVVIRSATSLGGGAAGSGDATQQAGSMARVHGELDEFLAQLYDFDSRSRARQTTLPAAAGQPGHRSSAHATQEGPDAAAGRTGASAVLHPADDSAPAGAAATTSGGGAEDALGAQGRSLHAPGSTGEVQPGGSGGADAGAGGAGDDAAAAPADVDDATSSSPGSRSYTGPSASQTTSVTRSPDATTSSTTPSTGLTSESSAARRRATDSDSLRHSTSRSSRSSTVSVTSSDGSDGVDEASTSSSRGGSPESEQSSPEVPRETRHSNDDAVGDEPGSAGAVGHAHDGGNVPERPGPRVDVYVPSAAAEAREAASPAPTAGARGGVVVPVDDGQHPSAAPTLAEALAAARPRVLQRAEERQAAKGKGSRPRGTTARAAKSRPATSRPPTSERGAQRDSRTRSPRPTEATPTSKVDPPAAAGAGGPSTGFGTRRRVSVAEARARSRRNYARLPEVRAQRGKNESRAEWQRRQRQIREQDAQRRAAAAATTRQRSAGGGAGGGAGTRR